MNKTTRSERIAMILLMLSQQPNKLHTLTEFGRPLWLRQVHAFRRHGGPQKGACRQRPGPHRDRARRGRRRQVFDGGPPGPTWPGVQAVCEKLSDPARILPAGTFTPSTSFRPLLHPQIGEIFAAQYYGAEPDVVVTVESKGVPIGLMTAQALGAAWWWARRDNRVTEGSVVTLN